jgi:MFS family permease
MMAVAQTLSWAGLYYIYGALLVWIEADTGWSRAELAVGLTLALLVSAASVTQLGKLVDRGLGVELLMAGALLGGLGLLALSRVQSLLGWYLVWALIGVAMSASLYDMCFAFLTRRLGAGARGAIIRVTLVGGLASTLAFPLGAALAQQFGWRGAVLAFAGIQIVLTLPLYFIAGGRLRRAERAAKQQVTVDKGALGRVIRTRKFWMLAALFGLATMDHAMLVTYFIPVFTGLGLLKGAAVAAASMVGPFQVLGRIVLMAQGARAGSLAMTRIALVGLVLASTILLSAGIQVRLVFLFAAIQGASVGMMSILRPVLIAEVLGRGGFGAISGAIAAVPLIASALAPLIGAVVLGWGGIVGLLATSLTLALVALALAVALRLPRSD